MKLIILGLIQGITEFLPVSSSGHLAVAQKLLGLSGKTAQMAAILHFGTLLSLVLYFFKDIPGIFKDKKLLANICLITILTGLIGISGKHFFESLFDSPLAISAGWLMTAVILFFSKRYSQGSREELNLKYSLLLGIIQGIAIIPGLSRSGTTISTLLFCGLSREKAFQYSFLAGIPAIAGAFLVELKGSPAVISPELALGILVAFLSGLAALKTLAIVLRKARFYIFGYYCFIIGMASLFLYICETLHRL